MENNFQQALSLASLLANRRVWRISPSLPHVIGAWSLMNLFTGVLNGGQYATISILYPGVYKAGTGHRYSSPISRRTAISAFSDFI